MSDLDKFIEVLTAFCHADLKNEYEVKEIRDYIYVQINAGAGYAGFHGIFTFDKQGKAISYGLWE